MRYLSLCSGIETASVAWQPLGWQAKAFSEIEPFPCAVLAHHYPNVPNLGDMTQIHDWRPYRGTVDLVVGGTPCQDFSIAGKRAGLAGERSALALVFVQILSVVAPQWFVWENVPGVFSTNGGRDFGAFLGALDDIGYSCAWRVLDAQYFGVPQRRRRVFVVGHLGDWRPAAAVLFEPESLRRDTPPRRKTRQDIAGTLKGGSGRRGRENGCECTYIPHLVGQAMTCHWSKGTSGSPGDEHHNLIAIPINTQIGLRHQALGERSGLGIGAQGDPAFTLQSAHSHAVFDSRSAVRRLTPREAERLQGFPDDYTAIEFRGKPAADGPRYKALGNSMAVPVMQWIGAQIVKVEAACAE